MKPRIFANKERFVNYLKEQTLIDAQKSVEKYLLNKIMPFFVDGYEIFIVRVDTYLVNIVDMVQIRLVLHGYIKEKQCGQAKFQDIINIDFYAYSSK